MVSIPREVIYFKSFEKELKAVVSDAKRADEFLRGAEWIVCRNPRYGTQMAPDSPVWFLPIIDIPGHPSVILYYTFNDRFVGLLSIQTIDLSGVGDL